MVTARTVSQGEVWWADRGEPRGAKPGFRRPVGDSGRWPEPESHCHRCLRRDNEQLEMGVRTGKCSSLGQRHGTPQGVGGERFADRDARQGRPDGARGQTAQGETGACPVGGGRGPGAVTCYRATCHARSLHLLIGGA